LSGDLAVNRLTEKAQEWNIEELDGHRRNQEDKKRSEIRD